MVMLGVLTSSPLAVQSMVIHGRCPCELGFFFTLVDSLRPLRNHA